jgi:hypothetical protein
VLICVFLCVYVGEGGKGEGRRTNVTYLDLKQGSSVYWDVRIEMHGKMIQLLQTKTIKTINYYGRTMKILHFVHNFF